MYSSKFINKNFLIKIKGVGLCGFKKALAILGDYLFKFVERALQSGSNKTVCKLRRGIEVALYAR